MKKFDISNHEDFFDKLSFALKNYSLSYKPDLFEKLGNEFSLETFIEYPEHDIFLEIEINIGKIYENVFILAKDNDKEIFNGSLILNIYSPTEKETEFIIREILPEYFTNPVFFPAYSKPPLLLQILNYNTSKNPYLLKGFYQSSTKLQGPETGYLFEVFLTNQIHFTLNLEEYDWKQFIDIIENDAISPLIIENAYIPFFIRCFDIPIDNPIEPPEYPITVPSLNYDHSQLENICKYIIPATKKSNEYNNR